MTTRKAKALWLVTVYIPPFAMRLRRMGHPEIGGVENRQQQAAVWDDDQEKANRRGRALRQVDFMRSR
jgi:hypothetical protein